MKWFSSCNPFPRPPRAPRDPLCTGSCERVLTAPARAQGRGGGTRGGGRGGNMSQPPAPPTSAASYRTCNVPFIYAANITLKFYPGAGGCCPLLRWGGWWGVPLRWGQPWCHLGHPLAGGHGVGWPWGDSFGCVTTLGHHLGDTGRPSDRLGDTGGAVAPLADTAGEPAGKEGGRAGARDTLGLRIWGDSSWIWVGGRG